MSEEIQIQPDPSHDPVFRLMNALGHRFSDPDLLTQALTHRSYAFERGLDRDIVYSGPKNPLDISSSQ